LHARGNFVARYLRPKKLGNLDDDDEGHTARTQKRTKGALWICLLRYVPAKAAY
jgi:hypothetical protein